jgi:hypothetical protein
LKETEKRRYDVSGLDKGGEKWVKAESTERVTDTFPTEKTEMT